MHRTNRLLFLWFLSLVLAAVGCDMSEDEALLNPPLPDSVQVRVINLSEGAIDFSLNEIAAVQSLPPGVSSTFSPFFNRNTFPITISGSGIIDTIQDGRFPTSASIQYHYNYIVAGPNEARRMITLATSSSEREDLEDIGSGRIYFVNAVSERSFLLKIGCRSGSELFPRIPGPGYGAPQDLPEGEHSLYLFEGDSATESATARLTLNRGEVIALIAAEENGEVRLYTLPLYAPTVTQGPLQLAVPETRNSATIRVLNGLQESTIDVGIVGEPTPIARDVIPFALSQPTSIGICTDVGGDTLMVVTPSGDTSFAPIQISVGGEITAIVFNDANGGVRIATLNRPEGSTDAGTFKVRGVNLTTVPAVSATAGAGAPAGIIPGLRLFSSPGIGSVTSYMTLPVGLYPLSLEQTSNGTQFSGGLYRFDQGFYTLVALEVNGERSLFVLNESSGSNVLEPLQASGVVLNFFSMVPNELITFEGITSLGTIKIENVAYSYVYPGILPNEQVTISATGVSAAQVDLTTSGYTIGVSGESNKQLLAFPRPTVDIPPGKAAVRFVNAVPGEGMLEIRTDSAAGQIEGSSTFGTPSDSFIKDARRLTLSVTIGGTNEEVARITGVELSQGRHYLLVIGPKGPTSLSNFRYGTLWMQE